MFDHVLSLSFGTAQVYRQVERYTEFTSTYVQKRLWVLINSKVLVNWRQILTYFIREKKKYFEEQKFIIGTEPCNGRTDNM